MYTGSELAHQIPSVAKNAHRSLKYFRASRYEIHRPRKPYSEVTTAMVMRYGDENPSASMCPPSRSHTSTPAWVTIRKGAQRIDGPTDQRLTRCPVRVY